MYLIIELNVVISQLEGTFLNLFHLIIPFVNNKQVLKIEYSAKEAKWTEGASSSVSTLGTANDFKHRLEGVASSTRERFQFPN